MTKLKAGLVGCGNISDIYLQNAGDFETFTITACADLDVDRAEEKARQYQLPKACTTTQLMEDPDLDFIINLTIPSAHADVALAALEAGKHVYGEKPLAATREEAEQMVEMAERKGLLLGNAPDTFLGGGIQTCRTLLDEGAIGRPVSASAFMMLPGHEHWHPDPAFYYQAGGGPMFDMGPYYLTALVSLLGPVARVTGSAKITHKERTIQSQPKRGQTIQVETPTQINGVLDFENGAVASIITSFDTWHHQLPHIEIYGTEGSMSVPDPNQFNGPVYVRKAKEPDWQEYPLTHGFITNSRGLGAAEFAHAIIHGETPRASGMMAAHVLDVMHGIQIASENERHYHVQFTCDQPKPLPPGLNKDNLSRLLYRERTPE
ncbi:Gfo/Idh/MocA family protein [Thalassobacillus sp. CUG 92003]|uniref:Gfo/Idh/MocA family protein n=1 Tax=Thalassobacillus sp. CUG 92003 TaxID=2736641 RepID=UPI0015E772B0|nr:Gfo/Idh/MocA family oxidoreductase [Thalassobacillus sp. CUG 92003]